jgi:pimeloyl-ACP methyl ester carboxylesterase
MSTFVLVAGAWHGAWCWQPVRERLVVAGHRVVVAELPGTGADTTGARTVTLASWAGFVADLVRAQAEAPVLVGHSRGGAVISQAAERAPDAIRRLVYVAAYLLPDGASVAECARADPDSLVAPNMVPARGGVTCTLKPEVVREAFYGSCTPETAAWAEARLTPEPLKPLVTPLSLTAANFGRVPRDYLACAADRTISRAAQRAMVTALPCEALLELDTDHSPFLSRPDELALWLGRR